MCETKGILRGLSAQYIVSLMRRFLYHSRFWLSTAGKCWCGTDASMLTINGGETPSDQCDFECLGTSGEICGGYNRMTVYSIDCYYPDTIAVDLPYTAEGCFVDSRTNRILPDGQTESPMSSGVRALYLRREVGRRIAVFGGDDGISGAL